MAIQIGDEPIFRATVKQDGAAVDLSQATALKLVFRKPTTPNTPIEVDAAFFTDGTDGILQFDCNGQSDLLIDDDGIWDWQPKGTLSSGRNFRCEIKRFRVKRNLN